MTPLELANALLRVIPGRKPEQCQNWTLAAKDMPETKSVRYTVSVNVSTTFDVPIELLDFPAELGAAFELEADDICEIDNKIRALAQEQTERVKKGGNDGQRQDDPETRH